MKPLHVITLFIQCLLLVSHTLGVVPQIKNIQVKCDEEGMKVAVEFDVVFNGIIYSKGHYADDNCKYVKENSLEPKYEFAIPVNGCGTMRSDTDTAKGFENIIIFQNDPVYQEVWDSARLLSCRYIMPKEELLTEKRVVFKPFLVEGLDIIKVPMQSFVGDAHKVDCWMDIKKGKYPELSVIDGPVRVGENLTLIIAIKDTRKNTDIRVKDCYAFDNADNAEKNDNPLLKLSGEDGCPLKEKLMDVWRRTKKPIDEREASLVAYTTITAFKFPQHTNVHLTCNVELCKEECAERCDKEPKELTAGGGDGGGEGDGDEEKPDQMKPDEEKPDEEKPDEEKPDEEKPDEEKPDEEKPDEEKPDEEKPDEEKPDEEKPDEEKPDEEKPDEEKPDEEKPDEDKEVTTEGGNGNGDEDKDDKNEDEDKDDGGEKDETTEGDTEEVTSNGNGDKETATTESSTEDSDEDDKEEDNESGDNGDAPDTKPSKPPGEDEAVTFAPKDEEEEEEDEEGEGSESTGAIKGKITTQETLEDDDEENDISTSTTAAPIKSAAGTKTKQKRKNEVASKKKTSSISTAVRPSSSSSSSSRDLKKLKDSIISRPPAFKPRPSRKALVSDVPFSPKIEKRILDTKNATTTTKKPVTTTRKQMKSNKKLKSEPSKLVKMQTSKPKKNTTVTRKPKSAVTDKPKLRAIRPLVKKSNPKAAQRGNGDKDVMAKQKGFQDITQLQKPKSAETTTIRTSTITTTVRPTTTKFGFLKRSTKHGRSRVPPPTTTTTTTTQKPIVTTKARSIRRLTDSKPNSTTQTPRRSVTPRKPEPVYTLPIPAALVARESPPSTSTVSERRWDGDAPFNDFSSSIAYEAKRLTNIGTRHIRSVKSVLSLFTPPRIVRVTLSI